jgi:3-oxoacyl-[acyl-carrier protein] reductase
MLCIITGAYGTLGAAVSRKLAADDNELVLVGRSIERLEHLLAVDFAANQSPASFMPPLHRVDALINTAAEQGPIGPMWECDPKAWQQTICVNLIQPVRLCSWVIPLMEHSRRGKIVNISGGGATGPRPGFAAYACAKVALVRFSETLAAEVERLNIDVNSVAPGIMPSGMTRAVLAARSSIDVRKEIEQAEQTLSKDPGNDLRAAELVHYLVSPLADGISGRLISAVWDDWRSLHLDKPTGDMFTLRRVVGRSETQLPAAQSSTQSAPASATPPTTETLP